VHGPAPHDALDSFEDQPVPLLDDLPGEDLSRYLIGGLVNGAVKG